MENDRDTSLQSWEFLTLFLPRFRVWAGDAVKVYGGDAATGVLLARLSGLGNKDWPVFRYPGTVTVLFETDEHDDGAYGKDFADGVSFAYDADAPPCGACGGHGACGGDGLCVCDAGYFGGDCSFAEHCLGYVAPSEAVWKSNLQPDFNVRICDRFDARFSAVLRELDESNRFVQKSAESTSM